MREYQDMKLGRIAEQVLDINRVCSVPLSSCLVANLKLVRVDTGNSGELGNIPNIL